MSRDTVQGFPFCTVVQVRNGNFSDIPEGQEDSAFNDYGRSGVPLRAPDAVDLDLRIMLPVKWRRHNVAKVSSNFEARTIRPLLNQKDSSSIGQGEPFCGPFSVFLRM